MVSLAKTRPNSCMTIFFYTQDMVVIVLQLFFTFQAWILNLILVSNQDLMLILVSNQDLVLILLSYVLYSKLMGNPKGISTKTNKQTKLNFKVKDVMLYWLQQTLMLILVNNQSLMLILVNIYFNNELSRSNP